MPVIDVHTHVFCREWLDLIKNSNDSQFKYQQTSPIAESIYKRGARFVTIRPEHMSYEHRIEAMDKAGVDMAIVSLTAPNVFFGDEATSLQAARVMNDDMAKAQKKYPKRIRWFMSIPWEHSTTAVEELKRAHGNGGVGVMTLANINGKHLTDSMFRPIWKAIDDLALPVLVHPTVIPGGADLAIEMHNLTGMVGFMFDTTLAVARMIYDGFFDEYPNLKLIASHAGGTLPYIVGRLDRGFNVDSTRRTKISRPPSEYLRHIYYDAVTYRQESLELCIKVGGADKVMYGSDYPHAMGDMVGCLERVNALPEAQRKAVQSENAMRIFKL